MSATRLSLSWNTFRNNICDGLSSFQQSEEFVDMTLAADGHFVKVHKMVLSMASPYLKQLITSAPCPHPVLFLNHISYQVLCGILEYIYSGEVLVNKDDIADLVQAGKALHIKGFEEMNFNNVEIVDEAGYHNTSATDVTLISPAGNLLRKRKSEDDHSLPQGIKVCKINSFSKIPNEPDTNTINLDEPFLDPFQDRFDDSNVEDDRNEQKNVSVKPAIQYTLSNHGHIQMILNRYMYRVVYQYKKTANGSAKLWKCVDNNNKRLKCSASVTTQNDIVVQRVGVHNHPFHDKKILKKVEANMVVTALKDAESKCKTVREERDSKSDSLDKIDDSSS